MKNNKVVDRKMIFKSKGLKKFVSQYSHYYNGDLRKIAEAFDKMGIGFPVEFSEFDEESTFITNQGHKITLEDDIDKYCAVIIVKYNDVEKRYYCFFYSNSTVVKLKSITIEGIFDVYLEEYKCTMKLHGQETMIPAISDVERYLNNLTYDFHPEKVLHDLKEYFEKI